MTRNATPEEHADHERDLRKHDEWLKGRRMGYLDSPPSRAQRSLDDTLRAIQEALDAMNAAFKNFTGIALWEAAVGAFFLASMALAGWTYGGWMWGTMP